MQVALAWGVAPSVFLEAEDEVLTTAIEILEDQAEAMERRR